MANYKHPHFLHKNESHAFDLLHEPASTTPYSGIYRCEVCGHEVVSTKGHPLPPQNHHQHPNRQPIRWRLVVTHTDRPS